jgi:hypothetical protein
MNLSTTATEPPLFELPNEVLAEGKNENLDFG